jgi:pyridoxamine 5'-phosphate oxidase
MPRLLVSDTPDEPLTLFRAWLADAIESDVPAPHAMTLSTVDDDGHADARVLILKDFDDLGWHFATHADSPKGRHITQNAGVALTFFWVQLGRQVRIKGQASPQDADASAQDFLARPLDSRAATLAGRQSEPMADGSDYTRAVAAAQARLDRDPELVDSSWTTYVVRPRSIEFWQASHDRAHVRVRYRAESTGWRKERLWP